MRFVDTNVLIYAASPAPGEAAKQRAARSLLDAGDLALSVQVLQEFYHQVTRPTRQAHLSHADALVFLQPMLSFRIQPMTVDIFHEAARLSRRYRIAYWDGAILAAARALGCDAVYSEDLSHDQDYDGVRVVNPFAEPPAS